MKKIIILSFVLISFAASAQKDTSNFNVYARSTTSQAAIIMSDNYFISVSNPKTGGIDQVFKLNQRTGDFFYQPTLFCKCRVCRKVKGWKLFRNAYHK
jgi:hypothetical protein